MTLATNAWVKGPAWDAAFILSALWLAPLVWLVDDIAPVYLVLTVALWIGHRMSSTLLAYFTPAYRPLLRAQRARFVWVPLGIAAGVFAFVLAPLPWSTAERVTALAIVDYVLLTYHFAAQHYGVLSLYRLRAGQARDARAKRIDRAYALGVGGVLVVLAEAIAGTVFFQEEWLGRVPFDARPLALAGTALVVAATLAVLASERRAMTAPRALYVLSVGALVVTAFWASPVVFVVLWTVQHWTAAVGLSIVVAGEGRARRTLGALVALVVVSVALFPLMEVEAAGDAGRHEGGLARVIEALASSPFAAALVALAFATAFVHYQLDRAVFRFSDPDVRRAAGALLR